MRKEGRPKWKNGKLGQKSWSTKMENCEENLVKNGKIEYYEKTLLTKTQNGKRNVIGGAVSWKTGSCPMFTLRVKSIDSGLRRPDFAGPRCPRAPKRKGET